MNDDNLMQTTEELSQDEWWLILWSLLTDLPVKEWDDFARDLIYKNRFSSSHKVIEVVKDFGSKCTATIKKGQLLHRARLYHEDPLREFLAEIYKDNDARKNQNSLGNVNEYYSMQLAALIMAIEKNSPGGKKIIDAYNKWQRKRFKGYNSHESSIPPAEKASSGRLNPGKICYLYLAEDPKTAIYEVRPIIGQYVSVATFKIIDEIKIYDLAVEIKPQEGDNPNLDFSLYDEIKQRFSEPNSGDNYKYLPTQYLGEQIKQMGFDGLRFRSSLKKGGVNIVLFDDKKVKPIRSDIIKVTDIELKYDNAEIYQLEEFFKSDKF